MAKHQALSARSRRTRTLIGGVMAGGVLALAAPAGLAFADTMGDTVGRPVSEIRPRESGPHKQSATRPLTTTPP